MIAGVFLRFVPNSTAFIMEQSFPNFFLIFVLPPILFEGTITMKTIYFYKSFGTITMFAIIGTIFQAIIIGCLIYAIGLLKLTVSFGFVSSMGFGSFISATDLVSIVVIFKQIKCDYSHFTLVFGESLLNDAASMTLYKYIFYTKHVY